VQQDEVDALVEGWERDGLAPSLIAGLELSKRMSRLSGLIEQELRTELAALGLTYADFDVLAALRRAGEPYRLRPSELTRALVLTSGGTSNVLHRLTKAGHVERSADADDGRARWVQLTPTGLDVALTALKVSGKVHADLFADVPLETVRAAADALREVFLARRSHRPRPARPPHPV
jgi:DNA-binding MarR family transcriptional regulator